MTILKCRRLTYSASDTFVLSPLTSDIKTKAPQVGQLGIRCFYRTPPIYVKLKEGDPTVTLLRFEDLDAQATDSNLLWREVRGCQPECR